MRVSAAHRGSIAGLQRRLAERADDRTGAWWERYLKGTAAFRGVPMPAVRAEVRAWTRTTGFADLSAEARRMALAKLEGRGRR